MGRIVRTIKRIKIIMRYLKRFNESNSEEYYQVIPHEDYFDHFDWEPFDNKEFDKISELSYLNKSGDMKVEFDEDCEPRSEIVISSKNGNQSIHIFKCTDEWYYVKYSAFDNSIDFYKCDQFEGLINLLKDIL